MKIKLYILILVICVFILSIGNSTISATEYDSSTDEELQNLILPSDEEINFDNDVANNEHILELISFADEKLNISSNNDKIKNKNLKYKSGGTLKIYGLKNIAPIELINEYKKNGNLNSLIMNDFGLLKLYYSDNNQYITSLFFVKENSINYAKNNDTKVVNKTLKNDGEVEIIDYVLEKPNSINGWITLGGGGMLLSDEATEEFSDFNNLKKMVNSLGINKPKNIKLLTGIPYMGVCIYFMENNEEFIVPLDDPFIANTAAKQVYSVKDVMNKIEPPVIETDRLQKEYDSLPIREQKDGVKLVADATTPLSVVYLSTYFTSGENQTTYASQKGNIKVMSANYLIVILLFLGITVVAVILLRNKILIFIKSNKK